MKTLLTEHAPIAVASSENDPLTDRVRATWSSGDFGRIAKGYERGAAEFIARLGFSADDRVLDVASGTGNLSWPAARAGATVVGIDIAPNLVAQAQVRAASEGLMIDFEVGNAEDVRYDDGAFDATVTMFGAMFAARPERAAGELLRVTKAGGRIAMANWTPTGFIGQMLKATVKHVPAPINVPSPLLWGTDEAVQERLGRGLASLVLTRRLITFEYPFSPEETVDLFRLWYGPTLRAFAALDESGRATLKEDLVRLWSDHNLAVDGSTRVHSQYLEAIGVVR